MTGRKLADSWVDAGRRRIIVRALHAYGLTNAEIARLLGVSAEQVRRDRRVKVVTS